MIVFQETTPSGKELIVRYPTMEDTELMQRYFNSISAERTFIRSQGEQVSLPEEKEYLKKLLQKIETQKSVHLLLFVDDKLAGISSIELSDKTEKHLGELGVSIAPEFRGQGLGKQFLNILMDEAEKALPDLEIILLGVFSPNKKAITLYKKLGFHEYGALPHGVKLENSYSDYILMFKQVRGSP